MRPTRIAISPQPAALLARGCLRWPAKLWAGLPAPWTIGAAYRGAQAFLVTMRAADFELARARRIPVIAGDEWLALAIAAELGRAALAIEQWLAADALSDDPWLGRPQPLLAWLGACECDHSLGDITTAQVFAHFGCELIDLDPPLPLPWAAR